MERVDHILLHRLNSFPLPEEKSQSTHETGNRENKRPLSGLGLQRMAYLLPGEICSAPETLIHILKHMVQICQPSQSLSDDPGPPLFLGWGLWIGYHVLTISIFDDEFFDVIKLFSQDTYHEVFSQLAKFIITRINQTRPTKIVDDKSLNSWLQEKIAETMNIKHGEYLKDIESGKILPNQKLVYENGFIKIVFCFKRNRSFYESMLT